LKIDVSNETLHDDDPEGISWLSAGIGFRSNRPDLLDRTPSLVFEFAEEQPIAAIRIWNYNERNLQKRGVKTVEITELGKVELPIGDGSATDIIFPTPTPFKKIEFKILSNHAGTNFSIPENITPYDNGFVGLSEVQFLVWGDAEPSNQIQVVGLGLSQIITRDDAGPTKLVPVKEVTVKPSSELVVGTHDRRAQYLVDGSGLDHRSEEWGWHRQGMPFYSDKVEYSRNFEIDKIEGRYSVQLPNNPKGWYGATARIFVNGNDAGFVISAPWKVDVTEFVKLGKNDVSVQIYGTLKNLLGPHHLGRWRGSAWPRHFHQAPDVQPPGNAYDTIGYGLFEPFELINLN
jgi:hypothetical protein